MDRWTPKAVITRFIEEAWNARQFGAIDELVHPAYRVGEHHAGPDAVRTNIASYVAAFPDLRVVILELIGEGDRVAAHIRLEGTHEGTFGGIPATGRRVAFDEMAFWRIEDGKLREGAFIAQALSLRIQLGALPATFWSDPHIRELGDHETPAPP